MSRNRFLRTRHAMPWGIEPGLKPELVPRTEHEETRRAARDWLRDRDETNAVEFEIADDESWQQFPVSGSTSAPTIWHGPKRNIWGKG